MNYGTKQRSQNRHNQTIYAFAHVECWIEEYAKSTDQPAKELCARVGSLLSTQGEGTGSDLPEMPSNPARVGQPVVEMEVVKHTPSRVHDGKQVRLNKDGRPRKTVKTVKWTPAKRRAASLRMKKIQGRLQEARRVKARLAA